jgi:hypothetical protein
VEIELMHTTDTNHIVRIDAATTKALAGLMFQFWRDVARVLPASTMQQLTNSLKEQTPPK